MIEFLTIKEVAEMFAVHPSTIHNWIEQGVLKAYHLPRTGEKYTYRIYKDEAEKLLQNVLAKALPPPEEADTGWFFRPHPKNWASTKKKVVQEEQEFFTIKEIADMFSTNTTNVYNLLRKKSLHCLIVQTGRAKKKYLIPKDMLETHLRKELEQFSKDVPPIHIEYDPEDADLILQGGWWYSQSGKRIMRSYKGAPQQLHRLIAQRILGETHLEQTKIRFKDNNPYNVRRDNLLIGPPPPVYAQHGDLLYQTLSSGIIVRISKEDEELFQQCHWQASFREDGTLWQILTERNPQRLLIRVAERMRERPLHLWEQATFIDGNPTHCERENIRIGYKQSYLDPAYLRYDAIDADLFRYKTLHLSETGTGNFYVVYYLNNRTYTLHREIMARKIGRNLFPFEVVKHYDEDQMNLRRENLYIPDFS